MVERRVDLMPFTLTAFIVFGVPCYLSNKVGIVEAFKSSVVLLPTTKLRSGECPNAPMINMGTSKNRRFQQRAD